MKRILNLAAVAALAIGLASCAKDATENIGGGVENTAGKFTFVLPAQSNVITYAAHDHAVAAIGDESKFDLTKTSIYIFDENDELEIIVASDILAGTHTDGRPTATINIGDTWNWNGTKTFFMVSNTDKEGGSSLPTAVPVAPADPITVTQFKDQMTSAMAATANVADAAFSSAGGMLLTDYAVVNTIQTAPATELELHRTVARIDIHNDVTFGKVTIKSISVSDANLNGYVFATDRGVATTGLVKGDIRDIAVSGTLVDGVATENIWGTTTKEDPTHKYQKQAAAMYLYPTTLKAGNATGTEITLVGEVNGIPAVYTLNKEDNNGDPVDVEIKANTRYIISAIDEHTHTFILTIADWDEGESLIGRPGNSAFGIASAGTPMTNATFTAANSSLAIGDPSAAFTATLNIKGSSAKGVTAAITSQTGTGFADVTGIVTAAAVYDGLGVTYATPYFNYVLTVEFPVASFAADANITADILLTDVASGANTTVRLHHEGSTDAFGDEVLYPTGAGYLPAVEIGSLYWAPVNVGATELEPTVPYSLASRGSLFQWGRNVPFEIVSSMVGVLYPNIVKGPVSTFTEANSISDFISAEGVVDGEGVATNQYLDYSHFDANRNWWTIAENTPCPSGWRMPNKVEFESVIQKYETAINQGKGSEMFNSTLNRLEISADNGNDKLIFPGAGHITPLGVRNFVDNISTGMYWTCEASTTVNALIINFNSTSAQPWASAAIAQANSVRCVKDVPQP